MPICTNTMISKHCPSEICNIYCLMIMAAILFPIQTNQLNGRGEQNEYRLVLPLEKSTSCWIFTRVDLCFISRCI